MVWMAVCYSRMGRNLWSSRIVGEETPALQKSRRRKKKVVKMFAVVVAIFAICWLPYHLYFFVLYYVPTIAMSPNTQQVYLTFYWFAMANGMVNPIIYYWMNGRYVFNTLFSRSFYNVRYADFADIFASSFRFCLAVGRRRPIRSRRI